MGTHRHSVPSSATECAGMDAASLGREFRHTPTVPETETTFPQEDGSGGVQAVHPKGTAKGGSPSANKTPTLASLQNQQCPNCSVGVLYVVRYDPTAEHEAGQDLPSGNQPLALPRGFESGGAYELKCAYCNWSASFALNPGQHHGKAR